MAFLTVIDNLTKQTNVRYRRLCNDPDFLTLTAGFILVPPASRSHKMFTREDFRRHLVPHLTIADFLPTSTDQENFYKSFCSMLADAIKLCAKEINVKLPKLNFPMPDIFPIDPSEKPDIMVLPTKDANEGVINEMIEILYSIQSDVGLSQQQCIEKLLFVCGDLMTVKNIRFVQLVKAFNFFRGAQFRQGECSNHMKLEWIETAMGLFHLQMKILSHMFKIYYGKTSDKFSFTCFIDLLNQDVNKLWNRHDSQVKDFNTCLDLVDTVLNGCLISAITRFCNPTSDTTAEFEANLGNMSQISLELAIKTLAKYLSNFNLVSEMRKIPDEMRNVGLENLLLFIQQGLMLRNLGLAIRQGDSGRILNSLSYFTI